MCALRGAGVALLGQLQLADERVPPPPEPVNQPLAILPPSIIGQFASSLQSEQQQHEQQFAHDGARSAIQMDASQTEHPQAW